MSPRSRDAETLNGRVIQSAVMRALFPRDATRRRFLAAVGSSGALAAISSVVRSGARGDGAGQGLLEKKDLKIGFIPITCATRSSWPIARFYASRAERHAQQDRRLGADPRQDAQ